jgi:TM2 domain-containing membrane protein YozV
MGSETGQNDALNIWIIGAARFYLGEAGRGVQSLLAGSMEIRR